MTGDTNGNPANDADGGESARLAELAHRLNTAERYLDIAEVILVALDTEGNITFINPKGCAVLGYERDELLGRSWFETCLPEEGRTEVLEAFHKLVAGELEPIEYFENAIVTRSGELRQIAWHNSIVEDEDGAIVETMSSGLDITDRTKAYEALAESEAWHRLVLDHTQAAVVVHAADTSILMANRRAADLLGLELESIKGRIITDPAWHFVRGDGTAMPIEEYPISRMMADKSPVEDLVIGLVWNENGPDPAVWVLVNGYPVLDEQGELEQMIVSFVDITSLRKAEEARRRLEAQILHAQKLESLGVLAGGIAHDFNNLLMGILGNAELAIAETPQGNRVRECLDAIERTCTRASDLCRQMLAYSGKGRFRVEIMDLSGLVSEMGHLLEVSVSKKVRLVYELSRDLPHVEGDTAQIQQVVMNLITNASEAFGDASGTVHISTGVVDEDDPRRRELIETAAEPATTYVYLEVCDNGCGMDAETRDRIFDPFFSTKFTGRGLGLAAVQGIVRGHSGAIDVQTEEDKGTTVCVLLPATAKTQRPPAGKRTAPPEPQQGGTVLLVDDEKIIRTTTSRILEQLGYDVITAVDGVEAVDMFRESSDSIICVVLDLTMPRMGGERALREMRKVRDDVPVILTSGYNEQEVTQMFTGQGLAGFLQKPFRVAELADMLRKVLTVG